MPPAPRQTFGPAFRIKALFCCPNRREGETKREKFGDHFSAGPIILVFVTTGSPSDISVIIPVLNDAEALDSALSSTQDCTGVERIVVDGGSSDESAKVAQSRSVKILHSRPGRAPQMNAGAEVAEGTFLVFLHADTRLPEGFDHHVRRILTQSGVAAGAFQLQIDAPSARLRLIEKAANWRSRYLQMPYGDQAIFLRAELFREVGGFTDLPIMEDFELIRRLQGRGRIVIAPAAVVTSARRWKKLGALRTTLINQLMILGFYLGFEPSRLARWYHAKRANPKFKIPNSKQTRNSTARRHENRVHLKRNGPAG